MKTLYSILVTTALTAIAHAQSAVPQSSIPPLPSGPLIQSRAPKFAQWIIRPGASATKQPAELAGQVSDDKKAKAASVVVMTKTGNIMLRQTVDDSGKTWNTWCIGQLQTTISQDGKSWMTQDRNPDPTVFVANYVDYSNTDFPGFEWISAKNYAGIFEFAGKKCIVFQDRVKRINDENEEPSASSAYVDLDTRLPVAVKMGTESYSYEFKSPPQSMLTLPPIVQQLVDNRTRLNSTASRRLPSQ